MLLIDTAHQRRSRRQDLIHEDEDGLLRRELDALADHVDELPDREICRDKIFLLVDGGNVGLLDFLADDLQAYQYEGYGGRQGLVRRGRTGMRSEYFWRMRSASALRFSNGLGVG